MSQAKLKNLDILSMEKEAANKANFDAIIKKFVEVKVSRQKLFDFLIYFKQRIFLSLWMFSLNQ